MIRGKVTLMHKDTEVLSWDGTKLRVLNESCLPFPLRVKDLDSIKFRDWVNDRVNPDSMMNLRKVCEMRGVGDSADKIVDDSFAISIIDCFWILRHGRTDVNWDFIKMNRDISLQVAEVSMHGNIPHGYAKKDTDGITSIFTINGYHSKAIVADEIWKWDGGDNHDIVGSNVAKYLGVPCQEVYREDPCNIRIKLFTTEGSSMVTMKDWLTYCGYGERDITHENFYNSLSDEHKKEYGRLCILNYLLNNTDFHGDNVGLLYSEDTFEIEGIPPAYDLNNSFENNNDYPQLYYSDIMKLMLKFVRENPDILAKLPTLTEQPNMFEKIDYTKIVQLEDRIKYLLELGEKGTTSWHLTTF